MLLGFAYACLPLISVVHCNFTYSFVMLLHFAYIYIYLDIFLFDLVNLIGAFGLYQSICFDFFFSQV